MLSYIKNNNSKIKWLYLCWYSTLFEGTGYMLLYSAHFKHFRKEISDFSLLSWETILSSVKETLASPVSGYPHANKLGMITHPHNISSLGNANSLMEYPISLGNLTQECQIIGGTKFPDTSHYQFWKWWYHRYWVL